MKQLHERIASASTLLMFGAFSFVLVAELIGQKDLARFSLWAFVASIIGLGAAFLPDANKKQTVARLDLQIRDFLLELIGDKYPKYDEERLIRRGTSYMRQNVVPQINSRNTYLSLLLFMEHGAMFLEKTEDDCLRWSIDTRKMPKFRYFRPQKRGKCFSCLYWTDPYDEAEEFGKDSGDLNCAVNPLHQDTQNGCDHHCDDWRKADLSESWVVRS